MNALSPSLPVPLSAAQGGLGEKNNLDKGVVKFSVDKGDNLWRFSPRWGQILQPVTQCQPVKVLSPHSVSLQGRTIRRNSVQHQSRRFDG